MGRLILLLEGLLAAWFVWRGLYPDFYYLTDVTALVLMWLAVAALAASTLSSQSRRVFQNTVQWSGFVGVACVVTFLIVFKVPMRLGFLAARAELSRLVEVNAGAEQILTKDIRLGPYTFSARETNHRHRSGIDAGKYRIFVLAGDQREAAFIYSTEGIGGLVYNPGSKGHLVGDWYWMKED